MARAWMAALATFLLVVGCVSLTPPVGSPQTSGTQTLSALVTDEPGATPAPQASFSPEPIPTPRLTLPPLPTRTPRPPHTPAPGDTPQPSPIDLGALLTAHLGVVNLTDVPVRVSINIYSDGEDQGTVIQNDIEPYGSDFQDVLEAQYAIGFTQPDMDTRTCIFTATAATELDFTLVNEDVLVTKAGSPPTTPDDLLIDTTSLCLARGASPS